MKITFAYPGGKARLAKTLVNMFPKEGRTYLEPCAGRGNSFFLAAQSIDFKYWWINDLYTAKFFKALCGNHTVPINSKQEYYNQWSRFKLGCETAIVLEPYLTFGGGGYGTGGPIGKGNGPTQKGYQATINNANTVLNKLCYNITNECWSNLPFERLNEDDFCYFDPPYNGTDVRSYDCSKFNHSLMLQTLRTAKFKWLLTEYYSANVVSELGEPFHKKELQLAGTDFNKKQDVRVECFWKNY